MTARLRIWRVCSRWKWGKVGHRNGIYSQLSFLPFDWCRIYELAFLDYSPFGIRRHWQIGQPFGHPFVIALLAVLTSRFRSFAAIKQTYSAFGYWMRSQWCVEAGQPQKMARTRWFTLRSVLETAARVCAYSDGYVQPLVRPGSHSW